jgi:hypothetical protein
MTDAECWHAIERDLPRAWRVFVDGRYNEQLTCRSADVFDLAQASLVQAFVDTLEWGQHAVSLEARCDATAERMRAKATFVVDRSSGHSTLY